MIDEQPATRRATSVRQCEGIKTVLGLAGIDFAGPARVAGERVPCAAPCRGVARLAKAQSNLARNAERPEEREILSGGVTPLLSR